MPEKNYPDYWLCWMCGKKKSAHIIEPDDDVDFEGWCYKDEPATYYGVKMKTLWHFEPVDNLTLIEKLAKQRGILNKTKQGKIDRKTHASKQKRKGHNG